MIETHNCASLCVNINCVMRLNAILRSLLVISLLVMSQHYLYAQSYHTTSKKAIKDYETARQYLYNKDYDKALSKIDRSLSYDGNFIDALLLKAELMMEMQLDEDAIEVYEKLFFVDSMAYPRASMALAKLYMSHHKYDESAGMLKWFLNLKSQKENYRAYAEKLLSMTLFRKELYYNPVVYNPVNVGHFINTVYDEYVNQYYPADDKLIFTKRYKADAGSHLEEKVFVATRYDSLWSLPRLMFEGFENVGAVNVSSDGNEIYFSASDWADGYGSCDIYCIRLINGRWSRPVNVRAVNTSGWESQPCLDAEGRQLFFVRSTKGRASSDIFVSYRQDDGSWGKAERLNSNVNTSGNEMAPFLHHDGQTLYFASDTHNGMGGYDLFMSRKDSDGEWSEITNLGYPLNTEGDEINIVVAPDAKMAFISAKRDEGFGAYDIYSFELDERFRPEPVDLHDNASPYVYAMNREESVSLRDIYFEFDSAELTEGSYDGVMALVDFLALYDEINIELIGHTDDMGDVDYNISLSERRAESVGKALVDNGISPERIKTKGCGATQPLFPNDSDKHRALNRRVEMRYINP